MWDADGSGLVRWGARGNMKKPLLTPNLTGGRPTQCHASSKPCCVPRTRSQLMVAFGPAHRLGTLGRAFLSAGVRGPGRVSRQTSGDRLSCPPPQGDCPSGAAPQPYAAAPALDATPPQPAPVHAAASASRARDAVSTSWGAVSSISSSTSADGIGPPRRTQLVAAAACEASSCSRRAPANSVCRALRQV